MRERKALKVTRGGHSFSPRYIPGKLDAAGRIRTQLPLHSSALDQGVSMLPGEAGSSPRPFCYVCFFVKLCTFNTLEECLIVRCTAALWTLSTRGGAVVVSIIASNKELHKKKGELNEIVFGSWWTFFSFHSFIIPMMSPSNSFRFISKRTPPLIPSCCITLRTCNNKLSMSVSQSSLFLYNVELLYVKKNKTKKNLGKMNKRPKKKK